MPLAASLGIMNALGFGLTALTSKPDYLVIGMSQYPWVRAYTVGTSGYISQFADSSLSILSIATVTDVTFNSLNTNILVKHNATSPYIACFKFSSAGFGTKYANPATAPSNAGQDPYAVANFNKEGTVVFSGSGTNGTDAYNFTDDVGFGTKKSDPATSSSGLKGMEVHPSGNYVVGINYASPCLHGYNWSNSSGFGTKLSNPNTGNYNGIVCKFTKTGQNVLYATYNYGGKSITFTNGVWGTEKSFIGGANYPNDIAINNTGNVAFVTAGSTTYLQAAPFSESPDVYYGTLYTIPSVLNQSSGGIAISKDGNIVSAGGNVLYTFTKSSGFGAYLGTPAIPLNNNTSRRTFNNKV